MIDCKNQRLKDHKEDDYICMSVDTILNIPIMANPW